MNNDGEITFQELCVALEERERHIDELEAVFVALEEENEKCRNELDDKINELKESQKILNQLRLDHDSLLKERTQLEDQVKIHKTQLDEQKNILAVASKSSEDAKKIQRDGNQQLYKLELENQRLRATILEIEENEDILVAEIETLVREKSEFQRQSEELASKCDSLSADVDEKARIASQLLQEKEKAENDMTTQTEEHRRAVDEWHRKDASSASEIARLLVELEQERATSRENAHVKENESLRNELIRLRKENQKVTSLYDQCLLDKNQAERDLDSAIQSLNQSKREAKDQITSGLQKVMLVETEARTKLDALQAKLDNATHMSLDAQEKIDDLREQLERSDARNALYEKNNGLSEVIRIQKQLEEDLRRRDFDLKRVNHTLGVEKESCRALTKVRDWLKDKANLGPDFTFDDPEMKSALELEDYRLQSENAELSRQIESLEGERIKLLSQLRERAIDIGEKGGRFLGMSPEQVSKVLEFASNLRRGVAELPLNDRSKELLSEISILKSEREIDKVTIMGLEREIAAREPSGGESNVLKQILETMTAENQKIRDELKAVSLAAKQLPADSSVTALATMEVMNQSAETVANGSGEIIYKHGDHPCDPKQFMCSEDVLLDSNVGTVGARNGLDEKAPDTHNLEKTLQNIPHERDALLSQVRRLVAETEMGSGRMDAISELVALMVKCKTLEDELTDEKGARGEAMHHLNDSLKRIIFLEKWKLNVINAIERHMATSCSTNQISADCFGSIRELLQQKDEFVSVSHLMNGIIDKEGRQEEFDKLNSLLKQTQAKLAIYVGDVKALHTGVLSLQDSCIDSSRVATHIKCLNDIIREKSQIIQEGKKRIADLKQRNLNQLQDREYPGHRSDRSTSTNSIDEAIARAANNTGYESHTRNNRTNQEWSEDVSKLLFEKENVICDLNHKIMELKQKLLHADVTYQRLSNEAQSMKADISTLVSRLGEAESTVNEVNLYQKRYDEAQGLLANAKDEVESSKRKVGALVKEREKQDAKIKYLVATDTRTKTILSVTRQGKARIEVNLKAATEEVASLKESLEKMGAQMNTLKAEKIEAQNEKLKLSKKARVSATKLKDLANECNRKENSTLVDELTKRVEVLNKTVSGLATQNSSLRCELAACKAKKKAKEEAAAAPPMPARGSFSRERPMSSARAKSLEEQVKSLEEQVKTLDESLAEEKSKYASESSSTEERYRKQIRELEKALQSAKATAARKPIDSDDSSREQVLSLTNENNALKQRIKAACDAENQLRQLKADNDALRKENERLSQVDHLDFFEEIEDLKYKYNEAVRQINQLTTR